LKLKNVDQVTPYLFENYLIISLDNKWIKVCNGIPKFTVLIDKTGHLVLLGPIVKPSPLGSND